MNRANILFTNGYRFSGDVDFAKLEASFFAIADGVEKFEHRLHFEAQNSFHWQHCGACAKQFRIVECDDIDEGFRALCRDSLSLIDGDAHCPMAMSVLVDHGGSKDFIIAQTSEHTYLDARSSEFIFNCIIDYYNALTRGDQAALEDIAALAREVRTISGEDILHELQLEESAHQQNLNGLTAYPVADVGRYAIPLHAVPECLEDYKKQRFAPVVRFFAFGDLLQRCRAIYPEVTQNSVICAALVKGFSSLNVKVKNLDDRHIISFKMLSDLLPPELRARFCGNYIAFVPVSVDADVSIEEMAKQIDDRVRTFKASKIDASLFKATEEAVQQALVGTADDALSFVVTNWNNYRFLHTEDFLHGCKSIRHQSGVNIDPRDTLGAVLVNRPILVINLSAKDEFCLSLFPSLRSEAENLEVVEHISAVFA